MAQMRGAVALEYGKPLALRELPVPVPADDQVLVRILASGVCHTDIHAIDGDWPVKARLPLIPGHEAVGVVAAAGRRVTACREGDRVGVFWLNAACGHCEYCTSGRETLCLKQKNTGYSADGTFADYCLAAGDYAVPVPQGDAERLAPIMCAGVTTYKGLRQTGAARGDWVAVSGVGGIGHLAVQYAKAMGFHVVALDVNDERLAQATACGADIVVNPQREFPVSKVVRQTGGVHGALITAVSPKAFEQGVAMLRRGGTCVFVGIPPGSFPLPIFDVVVKGLSTRGSLIGSRADVREALEFVTAGTVGAVVSTRPLEEVNEAIDDIRRQRVVGRSVLSMLASNTSVPVKASIAGAARGA